MTGIERLRLCERQLRADLHELYIKHVWDINVVPLYEEIKECLCALDDIADQIEREIEDAVADKVAGTLSAYELDADAKWYSVVEEGVESGYKAEYELISRYWLPRPRFEDGEPVKVGDRFLNALGRECVVHSVVSSDAFGRRIEGIVYASNCDCHITVGEGERVKRPEPPKVLDADGVEIKVGDEVWSTNDSGLVRHPFSFTVTEVEAHLVHGDGIGVLPCQVAHKRPEPPDTWERIEADSKKFVCDYYGRKSMFDCREGKSDACPVSGTDDECDTRMAQDLVRRCKALVKIEVE